jgi:hypothetical protein
MNVLTRAATGAIITLSFGINAYALRCGTELIQEGDSLGHVMQVCLISSQYDVDNKTADIKYLYMDQGGMKYELKFIDGKLYSIEGNR